MSGVSCNSKGTSSSEVEEQLILEDNGFEEKTEMENLMASNKTESNPQYGTILAIHRYDYASIWSGKGVVLT